MTEWVFVLVSLLVLPIVLLFCFVGCEPFGAAEAEETQKPPQYRDHIMAEPDVIAYWRLVDDATATTAKDEKGFHNGEYKTAPPLPHEGPNPGPGSEPAGGGFVTDHTGLITSDKGLCRFFNGGYVHVPFNPALELYTDEFTIEAWIDARWTQRNGYDHTLFSAGGYYRKPFDPSPSYHGFRIFANRQNRWQVSFSSVVEMTTAPLVVHNTPTHLAVTVEHDATTGQKKVSMFINGKVAGLGIANYSPPDGAPLFIGVFNRTSDPSNPPEPRYPVLSLIQEVVLYKKALSQKEIENHFEINK